LRADARAGNSGSISLKTCRHWHLATLTAVGALLLFPGLGGPVVHREQELRVLLTARDMAEGGNWIIPHFLGEPRLRKPPLMYWLVAAADRIAGTTHSPLISRAPSAAAGILLLLALYGFGGGSSAPAGPSSRLSWRRRPSSSSGRRGSRRRILRSASSP